MPSFTPSFTSAADWLRYNLMNIGSALGDAANAINSKLAAGLQVSSAEWKSLYQLALADTERYADALQYLALRTDIPAADRQTFQSTYQNLTGRLDVARRASDIFQTRAAQDLASAMKGFKDARVLGGLGTLFDLQEVWDNLQSGNYQEAGASIAGMIGSAHGARAAVMLAAWVVTGATFPVWVVVGTVALALAGGEFYKYLFNTFVNVDAAVSTVFNAGKLYVPRRDPLVLDLDGDGIETVGLSATSPILFDHDADGIKTGTGWVKQDDGFLVLDRNGNGTIDDGRELFGDPTPLNGTGSLDATAGIASDGFAALTREDSNADGIVNATDTRWANLRVWRDLNQDGRSQSGELLTLSALGITAIRLQSTVANQNLANGNVLHLRGTYVRSNGTEGVAGTVQEVSNLDFIEDTFHREFADNIPIPDAIAALPSMPGPDQFATFKRPRHLASVATRF